MAETTVGQNSELLNSWKEISSYVGRGVRTVQRWERDFGLPIRRPGGHVRGSVIAMRKDIDQWLATRSAREALMGHEAQPPVDGAERSRLMLEGIALMKDRYHALLEENAQLKENLARVTSVADQLQQEIKQYLQKAVEPEIVTTDKISLSGTATTDLDSSVA